MKISYENIKLKEMRIKMNKIEICCGSYVDCLAAQKGNANRIELCR